jgi:hypothetical protein
MLKPRSPQASSLCTNIKMEEYQKMICSNHILVGQVVLFRGFGGWFYWMANVFGWKECLLVDPEIFIPRYFKLFLISLELG